MMWIWDQSAGELRRDGTVVSRGYAGCGRGKNNPAMQAAVGVGPIPRGHWLIAGVHDSATTGPYTIVLEPQPGTNTFGRSAFRIHGDSIAHPGEASHGCIILPRAIRERIMRSGDRELEVVE
ncbi:MAG: tlde1 domain-containing protein [Sphingomonas sp.]